MSPDNLNLWNKYCRPPDDAMKKFTRAGGFRGTAIDPMWLIQSATTEWGPMGGKWGLRSIAHSFHPGADDTVMHMAAIVLFHPDGEVPCVGQTMFVAQTKKGLVTDEEAPKKSVTDAISKALSWLGFAADVYLGKFDGNKYTGQGGGTTSSEPKASTPDQQMEDLL
ncbi:MAG: hypothetical protein HQ581_01210 [Planctomycetes bacterium]|nr:hypothetical protein [Planctomycetota bacterium]